MSSATTTDQELDEAVARARGWKIVHEGTRNEAWATGGGFITHVIRADFRPSTCADHAIEAVETLDMNTTRVGIGRTGKEWSVVIGGKCACSPTLPRALCLAFLAAKGASA